MPKTLATTRLRTCSGVAHSAKSAFPSLPLSFAVMSLKRDSTRSRPLLCLLSTRLNKRTSGATNDSKEAKSAASSSLRILRESSRAETSGASSSGASASGSPPSTAAV